LHSERIGGTLPHTRLFSELSDVNNLSNVRHSDNQTQCIQSPLTSVIRIRIRPPASNLPMNIPCAVRRAVPTLANQGRQFPRSFLLPISERSSLLRSRLYHSERVSVRPSDHHYVLVTNTSVPSLIVTKSVGRCRMGDLVHCIADRDRRARDDWRRIVVNRMTSQLPSM
jgi:hypothetical protein